MSAPRRPVDLDRLAIFPLPGALLFPHAVLPLHVFEPRYRRMLEDCLAGDRAIAIACLAEHEDPVDDARANEGRGIVRPPRVRPLVGVGTIVAHEPLPDGRSNILLRGLGRARIDEELALDPSRPYRLVRASWVVDEPLPEGRDHDLRQTLALLAGQLADRLPEGGDTLRALVGSQPDAGALSDLLAAALVTKASARLRLFESLDIAARADGVSDAIAAALTLLADGSRGEMN